MDEEGPVERVRVEPDDVVAARRPVRGVEALSGGAGDFTASPASNANGVAMSSESRNG
jgi:hypothetical protein